MNFKYLKKTLKKIQTTPKHHKKFWNATTKFGTHFWNSVNYCFNLLRTTSTRRSEKSDDSVIQLLSDHFRVHNFIENKGRLTQNGTKSHVTIKGKKKKKKKKENKTFFATLSWHLQNLEYFTILQIYNRPCTMKRIRQYVFVILYNNLSQSKTCHDKG